MFGQGIVVGKKAPDFQLEDQTGKTWTLADATQNGPVLFAFYPGDFTPVCTQQLCNYRDAFESFRNLQIRILGVSKNDRDSHARFIKKYQFPFPLLSDPENKMTKEYGCISYLMLGAVSRAVCIVNQGGIVLYRYVEPTTLTRRKADELVGILQDLKENNLI